MKHNYFERSTISTTLQVLTNRMRIIGAVSAALLSVAHATFSPAQGLTFAYYAASAYCDQSQLATWTCKPCHETPAVTASTFLVNSTMDSFGFVAKQSDGVIVVGFRGTDPSDIKNWIDDLWYFPTPIDYPGCSGCQVHSGFYDTYLEVAGQMLQAIDKYGGRNAPAIYVTGHSLGGAMSTIAVFELLLAGYPVTTHIDFGRPRAGNPTFAQAFEKVLAGQAPLITLNEQSTAKWSEVLKAAVHRTDLMNAPEARHKTVAEIVKHAAMDFQNTHPAAGSPNRAAKHAAMAHILSHMKSKVFKQLQFPAAHTNGTSYRVTHNADPVPHLPLESMGFAHPTQEIFYNEAENGYKVCSPTNGEDPTCSDSIPLDIWIPDHLRYMGIEISSLC